MRVAIARPVPARNNTAFQTQSDVYSYLIEKYPDVEIDIIADASNNFECEGPNVIEVVQTRYERLRHLSKKALWKIRDRDSIIYPDFSSLQDVIEEQKYDIIETSDPTLYPYAQTAYTSARNVDASLVCGSSVTKDIVSPIERDRAQSVIDSASTIICPTPLAYDRFKKLSYLDEDDERVFISGYPIDHQKFQPGTSSDDITRVISVGRLDRTKGFEYLAKAIKSTINGGTELSWEVVGDGDMHRWLVNFVEKHGLEDVVTIHGEVNHNQIPKMLSESDIFLLHSISTSSWEEYFGVAYAEAMSAGLPVIGSRSGAIPWVVRDRTDGILLDEGDISGIRSSLEKLCQNPELREELGSNGRERVLSEFSIETYAEKLYDNWNKIS